MAPSESTSDALLDNLIPFDLAEPQPVTPQPEHATIEGLNAMDSKSQENTALHMTPPPSTQVNTARGKGRTPTPTYSSISTPPPTVDLPASLQGDGLNAAIAATMSTEQITNASTEELRTAIAELQSAYQEAKMNAAHYKLQYQMLAQESEAAMERMDVEARMAQHENNIIRMAEQARASSTPLQPSSQDGLISVQKDLYQYMCLEIQQLHRNTETLQKENSKQDKLIVQQEAEIETLSERVALLRDRIRSNREHLNHLRRPAANQPSSDMSRSAFNTPSRANMAGQDQFAALLQASEIARKEANPARGPSHNKADSTYPQVTMTPQRYQKPPTVFATPGQRKTYNTPASTSLMSRRPPTFHDHHDIYPRAHEMTVEQPAKTTIARQPGSRSEETVSNSDRGDVDSEAETDIIELDEGAITESQASIKASLMLRSSHEDDLDGRIAAARSAKTKPRQTTLFGAIKKHGIDRSDSDRPAKKGRTGGVGLGITGTRH